MELAGSKKSIFRIWGSKQQPLPDLSSKSARVESIDLLRGAIMIVMALDHVRDYFHADALLYSPTDLNQTSVILFFTRFITHYCAPLFMFLSGISAYLVGMRKGKPALAKFLLTRGVWLVFLEMVVVNFAWYFNPTFPAVNFMVIWALGMSMIALAGLIYLPQAAILTISLLMIFGHNLLDSIHVQGQTLASFGWSILHEQNFYQYGRFTVLAAYPLIPWIGVMALGYCIGKMYEPGFDASRRKKLLLQLGLATTLFFIALRFTNWYGDPFQWEKQSSVSFTVLSFLNVSKYPPSLLYLAITLGPGLIFLSLTENARDWISERVKVIGRVPMFYYLVHIYLIHLGAMVAAQLTGFGWQSMVLNGWIDFQPSLKGYGFSLATTYMVWAGCILLLYFLCKRYDRYKRTHQHWWLSYL